MAMVGRELRNWFIVHFFLDALFAIPLIICPALFLNWLGWEVVDPIAARLVGAALLGIGGASFVSRNAPANVYREMLNLKMIWSFSAVVAVLISLQSGGPLILWGILAVFALFFGLWSWFRIKLS